jgi:hypothetical protein
MPLRRLSSFFVIAFAPFVLAAASPPALSLGPSSDGGAHYHLSFDGHLWNGAHKVYEHQISLRPRNDAAELQATVDEQETGKRLDLTVKRDADGVLVSADPQAQFSAYNAIARLATAAPAKLAAGTAWDAQVPVDIGDALSVSVPVHAWVASIDGGRTTIQGTGSLDTTVTYSGFTVPINLAIRLASAFDDGTFARADSAAKEVIHAGPQTQTLDWTWSLTRT